MEMVEICHRGFSGKLLLLSSSRGRQLSAHHNVSKLKVRIDFALWHTLESAAEGPNKSCRLGNYFYSLASRGEQLMLGLVSLYDEHRLEESSRRAEQGVARTYVNASTTIRNSEQFEFKLKLFFFLFPSYQVDSRTQKPQLIYKTRAKHEEK